jgi:hypothetical protein
VNRLHRLRRHLGVVVELFFGASLSGCSDRATLAAQIGALALALLLALYLNPGTPPASGGGRC